MQANIFKINSNGEESQYKEFGRQGEWRVNGYVNGITGKQDPMFRVNPESGLCFHLSSAMKYASYNRPHKIIDIESGREYTPKQLIEHFSNE